MPSAQSSVSRTAVYFLAIVNFGLRVDPLLWLAPTAYTLDVLQFPRVLVAFLEQRALEAAQPCGHPAWLAHTTKQVRAADECIGTRGRS